jgi:hypothetical protein
MFDLQHFDYQEDFSAEELAGLMIGIDPRDLGQSVLWRTIEPALNRIERDYHRAREAAKMIFVMHNQDQVESKLKIQGLGLFSAGLQNAIDNYSWMKDPAVVLDWIESGDSQIDRQRFDRAAIVTWLAESNLKSKYKFDREPSSEQPQSPASQQAQPSNAGWPWGSHTTQDLEDLKAAALHFWRDYDPKQQSNAPKNDAVISWLMKERNTVEDKAKKIASILRPKDLKSGPRVSRAKQK